MRRRPGYSVHPDKPTSPPTGPPPTPPPPKDTRDGRVVPKPMAPDGTWAREWEQPAFDARACLCLEGHGTHAQCPVLGHPGHPRAFGDRNLMMQGAAQLIWPKVRLPRTMEAVPGCYPVGQREPVARDIMVEALQDLNTALKRFQRVLDETLEEMP